jgi:hypothetical protein
MTASCSTVNANLLTAQNMVTIDNADNADDAFRKAERNQSHAEAQSVIGPAILPMTPR